MYMTSSGGRRFTSRYESRGELVVGEGFFEDPLRARRPGVNGASGDFTFASVGLPKRRRRFHPNHRGRNGTVSLGE